MPTRAAIGWAKLVIIGIDPVWDSTGSTRIIASVGTAIAGTVESFATAASGMWRPDK